MNNGTNGYWCGRTVLVTGADGFIGSHLTERLVREGAIVTALVRGNTVRNIRHLKRQISIVSGDCSDIPFATKACQGQEVVFNLAAHVGGIEYNRANGETLLRDNQAVAVGMLSGAWNAGVERFLVVSSACVYPHDAVVPTSETEGHRGEPEPTNSGYGWAKRIAELFGMRYASQYGMKVGIVRPYNAYGPRDHFDPTTSHVIPALVRRICDGEDPIVVWGSGRQTRAFLYVEDIVEGMMRAIERYPVPDPVNLGTDEEISIADLVRLIIELTGSRARVVFDPSKPDGSPRRNSDNTKATEKIGFVPSTPLVEGLRRTIAYYRELQHSEETG